MANNPRISVTGQGSLPEKQGRSKFDEVRYKARRVRKFLFPEPVWVVLIAVLWAVLLPGIFAVLTQNIISGVLAGLGLIITTTLVVLLWDTYTPKWRTMAWSMLLSSMLAVITLRFVEPTNGVLMLVIVPTGLFVAARANMNFRKLILMIRDRRSR